MAVRVKICGITRVQDAEMAAEMGADAIGMIFFKASPRCVELDRAREICKAVGPFITTVGVFVDPEAEELRRAVGETGMTSVQLHGDESAAFCREAGRPVVKAIRVKDRASVERLAEFGCAAAFLLDSYVAGRLGGTGERFNWDLAVMAKKYLKPVILAGGLEPENVRAAIEQVRPYGVDVSSGVELAPGLKDWNGMREFIRRAKEA